MLQAIAAGAMFVSSLTSPVNATLASTPPPDRMVVDVATAIGSGCPFGTAEVATSNDHTAFTVAYSSYMAQVGVGASPIDFRKNCQLGVNVHVPQGYTYAIAGTDYRGYAHLAPGATGYESANYYFQGESQTTRIRHNFNGYKDGDWQTTDTVGISSLSFLPCGEERNLNINTELRVSAGASDPRRTTSFLSMDSTDTSLDTVYHLAWKRC
jgi:hypothetical protein